MKRDIVVGLDLGTTKISAAVGEINLDRSITVLAVSKRDSAGLRRGSIVDIEATAKAVDEVLEDVERIAGVQITSLRTSFSGITVSSAVNRATVAVGHPSLEITREDVDRAIESARMIVVPPDRSVVHIIPRHYTVDGYEGIIDPAGMMGSRLEVEVVVVTAATSSLQNMVKAVSRTGTKVREIILASLLSAESVLQPAEKDMGVVLVDMGGGTTDIAVYEQGTLIFASSLPIGSDYITRDIAVGLRTTTDDAKVIKEKYGFAKSDMTSDEKMVQVGSIYGKETREVSEQVLASIIQARLEEILELLDNELKRSGFKGMLPAGLVLTGGSALLKGIIPVCEEYLNMPVRIGYPENVGRVSSEINSPEYSTVLGALLYANRTSSSLGSSEHELSISGMFARLLEWFRDLFK
ncbi:MAG: cell division protein FtsA [Acidobacteriota bacterium]